MDLRLADIAPGSTRIFITGKLSPDLFGQIRRCVNYLELAHLGFLGREPFREEVSPFAFRLNGAWQ